MPRTLICMRHAEAPQNTSGDFDRTLNRAGRAQAQSAARIILQQSVLPDVVLHSHAPRIMQTLDEMELVWSVTGKSPQRIKDERLYNTPYGLTPDNIFSLYQRMLDFADDAHQTLLVLGHSPAIHHFVEHSYGGKIAPLGNNFPSATACVFTTDAESWSLIEPENLRLHGVIVNGQDWKKVSQPRGSGHPEGFPAPTAR